MRFNVVELKYNLKGQLFKQILKGREAQRWLRYCPDGVMVNATFYWQKEGKR